MGIKKNLPSPVCVETARSDFEVSVIEFQSNFFKERQWLTLGSMCIIFCPGIRIISVQEDA
jgi:activator of 2-hydroxyglutaryl-CoA dehydratase